MIGKLALAITKAARLDLVCRVVATAVAMCALPHTAHAQLRSFHAINYVTLDVPPPGLEKLHSDLANELRGFGKLLEPPRTLEDGLAKHQRFDPFRAPTIDPRALCARCRLRSDLPQPRAIGLECSDYVGKYVGVVRFSTAGELQRWFKQNLLWYFTSPAGRPLNTIRTFVNGSKRLSAKQVAFMKQLLRDEGTFLVQDSTASLLEDELESLIWLDLQPVAYSTNGTVYAKLELKDRRGHSVRRFEIERPRFGKLVYRMSVEETIRHLVDRLIKARLEDEEIYMPRN